MAITTADLFDPRCKRKPEEIPEYSEPMTQSGLTPAQYVMREEGTLNRENGHFLCTQCYIEIGQPSSPTGWVCP